LNDSSILSYGSNRVCYLDETNPSKIIKVARHPESWKKDHRQSFSEWYVSKSIASANSDCFISQCQSWVRTNKGPGLVVDRIVDDHGQSITLRKLLFRRELNVEHALLLIEKIIYNFSVNGVPASDFNIDNFVIEGEHANNKLVMIDGFSPKKINLKHGFFCIVKYCRIAIPSGSGAKQKQDLPTVRKKFMLVIIILPQPCL